MALLTRMNNYVSGPNLDARYYITYSLPRMLPRIRLRHGAPDLISHSPVPLTKPIILERLFIYSSGSLAASSSILTYN